MDKLTEVYNDLHNAGVMMFSCPMHFSSDTAAVTIEVNGDYGIFLDTDLITTEAEENAAVAHEAGHIFTGSTHSLSSEWAYDRNDKDFLCRVDDIVYEAAEYASEHTEWHPEEAWGTIEAYRDKTENISKEEYDKAIDCMIGFYEYFYSRKYGS